uniref:C2H2-type domain-containing protein n=1 Tax=Setaria viridis TaxID=4556 RepID=A0A4U6UYU4_SETVI|nr:hypothetical protein SEVIR_4G184800v2 [Setaria viridis]
MSKGSFLCSLVLLQVCIVQLSLISSQLTGAQVGDNPLCQDPIQRARLMSSHGLVDTGDEYASNDGGVAAVVGGEAAVEEEEGLLHPDGEDSCGTKDSSGIGGDVECPECGKFFKNDKSLFGHLQSHPNRGYKGALLRL